MNKKHKALLASFLILLGGGFNVVFSSALHLLLSNQTAQLSIPSLADSFTSLLTHRSHLHLFLCLQSIVLLMAVLYFLLNSQPYQSTLRQVAPGIETPVPTGQHQHGSARWLKQEEWSSVFDQATLDLTHPFIQHLIRTGDDYGYAQDNPTEEAIGDHESPNDS